MRILRSFFVVLAAVFAMFMAMFMWHASVGARLAMADSKTLNDSPCGPFDPDCSQRLMRIISGVHFAEMKTGAGVRYGDGDLEGAVRFDVTALGVNLPAGDLEAIAFEAVYVPEEKGFRLRLSFLDSDVLFFCQDEAGNNLPPLTGIFQSCRPDGMLGVGGSLLTSQYDGGTGRLAVRWAEANFVINFLRNGNSLDFLQKQLVAFLGADLNSVWAANTPGAVGSSAFALRANLGIAGTIRTTDNHWELTGYAGFRPNVTQWDNWSAEARTQLLYHWLINRNVMGSAGLDVEYSHWTMPWQSMGAYASDRNPDSLFIGLVFGAKFQ